MNPFIRGTKIDLYIPVEDDVDFLWELVNLPEIRDYISVRFPILKKRTLELIQKENFLWLVIKNKKEERVGNIQLESFNYVNRRCMLGISLHPDFQNKGYGTEATSLMVDYAFNVLNMHKIGLEVYAYNKRAIRVYEKIGFKQEALYKKHSYKNGKYEDLLYMAIREDEYKR